MDVVFIERLCRLEPIMHITAHGTEILRIIKAMRSYTCHQCEQDTERQRREEKAWQKKCVKRKSVSPLSIAVWTSLGDFPATVHPTEKAVPRISLTVPLSSLAIDLERICDTVLAR
jgi:hypothetical protein